MDSARVRRLLRRFVVYPLAGIAVPLSVGPLGISRRCTGRGRRSRGNLALTGATVLVGPDLVPRRGTTILINDGRIVEVAADDGAEIPAAATVVDLAGMTVLPGLVDMHVHLGAPEREAGQGVGPLQVPGIVLDAVRFVPGMRRAFVEHGVTAVRSLGDDHQWVIDLRRRIRDGELEGPRVFTAGPLFTTPGGHPVVTLPLTPTLAVADVALPPRITRVQRQRVAEFHAAGGRVVVGSDAGMPGVPFGGGVHRELRLLVEAGITPRDALKAATSGAAEVLGTDDIGVIEPGRAADLLVVDGDPLQRIGAVERVVMVLRDGRIVVHN
jgi:imidazolonepropionase-like amidohydrolase